MTNFEIGDKVKSLVRYNEAWPEIGEKGTVIKTRKYGKFKAKVEFSSTKTLWMKSEEIEHVQD